MIIIILKIIRDKFKKNYYEPDARYHVLKNNHTYQFRYK